jgi:Tol biopolymer transport system component
MPDRSRLRHLQRMMLAVATSTITIAGCGGGGGGDAGTPIPSPSPSPTPSPSPSPSPPAQGSLFYISSRQISRFDLATGTIATAQLSVDSTEQLGQGGSSFTDVERITHLTALPDEYTVNYRQFTNNGFANASTKTQFVLSNGFVSGPIQPSADGRWIAVTSVENQGLGTANHDYVTISDRSANGKTRVRDMRSPAWIGNDRLVAAASDGLFLIDIATTSGNPSRIGPVGLGLPAANTAPLTPAISPDGRQIAYVQGDALWRINIDGTGLVQLSLPRVGLQWPAWSPDGTQLAVQRGECPVSGTSSPQPPVVIVSATTPRQDIDSIAPVMRDASTPLRFCGPRYWR